MKWIIEFKKMVNLFKWLCDLVFLYKLSTMGYYDMVVYSMSHNLVAWIGQINSLQTNQWSSFFCFLSFGHVLTSKVWEYGPGYLFM